MRYFYPNKQNYGIYFLRFALKVMYFTTKALAVIFTGTSDLLKIQLNKWK